MRAVELKDLEAGQSFLGVVVENGVYNPETLTVKKYKNIDLYDSKGNKVPLFNVLGCIKGHDIYGALVREVYVFDDMHSCIKICEFENDITDSINEENLY